MPYKNKEDKKLNAARYHLENREEHNQSCSDWYKDNKALHSQYTKSYYEEHKEEIKLYNRERNKAHRLANRQIALEKLGNKCVACASTANLEFDHIDPKLKTIKMSDIFKGNLEKMLIELQKCQLLCQSCHVKKTVANKENQPSQK